MIRGVLTGGAPYLDLHARVLVDFIGRYENLAGDFEQVCRRIGVPPPPLAHKRQAKDRAGYQSYYTDATRALVAEHFAPDIEMFGYRFEE